MAAELRIDTVARSISELVVEGLTIRDADEIKVNPEKRKPVMFPDIPFVTDLAPVIRSFGGASAMWDIYYTLNYRLLFKPIGTERTMEIKQVVGLVKLIAKIWDAVLAIGVLEGCEDISISGISDFGPVAAPNSTDLEPNIWWGCILSFRIMEQIR